MSMHQEYKFVIHCEFCESIVRKLFLKTEPGLCRFCVEALNGDPDHPHWNMVQAWMPSPSTLDLERVVWAPEKEK